VPVLSRYPGARTARLTGACRLSRAPSSPPFCSRRTAGIAGAKFPEATQIVDIWHAREHLHDLARLLEFMLGDQRKEWLAARLDDLDQGDIDGICAAARACPSSRARKASSAPPSAISRTTPPACATTGSASAAC
jgi:hypothetical protein